MNGDKIYERALPFEWVESNVLFHSNLYTSRASHSTLSSILMLCLSIVPLTLFAFSKEFAASPSCAVQKLLFPFFVRDPPGFLAAWLIYHVAGYLTINSLDMGHAIVAAAVARMMHVVRLSFVCPISTPHGPPFPSCGRIYQQP